MVLSGLLEQANKGFIIDDIQAIVVQILHAASLWYDELMLDKYESQGSMRSMESLKAQNVSLWW